MARAITALMVPLITFIVLYFGFIFLRDSGAPHIVIAIVAILWGVGGVASLYYSVNWFLQRLSINLRSKLVPFLFIGPAVLILSWYLFIPTLRSLYLSFFDKFGKDFVGLENYIYIFKDRTMKIAFINNIVWLILGTGLSVFFGLIFALLANRSRMEKIVKAIIFMPMAISFVGAGVIWKFVYAYRPAHLKQIGLLNAILEMFGRDPVNWLTLRPWNTIFLIIILVWLQTGFAMIIFSAAIKQVPAAIKEAAKIDGAKESQVIFKIILPYIKSTIITVSTTILLVTLKIFDIVFTMTNGLFGTEVLASQQYKQMFKFLHNGRGAAISIVILIAVIPVMWYNLKQFGKRKVF